MSVLRQIMQKPIPIENSSSIHKAMTKMIGLKKSRLLTTNYSGKIIGIITEKDIGLFLLSDESEKNLTEIPVSIIEKPLIEVGEVTPIRDVAGIMNSRKIGSVGVSTADTIGIITKTDLVRFYIQNYVGLKRVGDAMTVSYSSMNTDDPLYSIVTTMFEDKVSRLIIKDNQNSLKGVITFRDLFRLSMTLGKDPDVIDNNDPVISVIFPRKGFLTKSGFGTTTFARDIMTPGIKTIDYNDDLVMACIEMIESNINGLGVLVNDRLSGIVSKSDIVRIMSELD